MKKTGIYTIGMHLLNSLNWVRMYLIVSKSKIQIVLRSLLSFIITSGTTFLAWAHRMTHCLQRVNILRKKSNRHERILRFFENSAHLFSENTVDMTPKIFEILRVKHWEIWFHLNFMVLQRILPNFLKKENFEPRDIY